MTKEEAIAKVRSVKRRCRGQLSKEGAAQIQALVARAPAVPAKADAAAVATHATAAADLAKKQEELVASLIKANPKLKIDGDARLSLASFIDGTSRVRCGADFNDIVAAGPYDGKTHAYKCPKCGVAGEYRAPKFTIEPTTKP